MSKLAAYKLMHKNIDVALITLDEELSESKPMGVRRNPAALEHFPIGGQMNEMKFIDWWRDRAIPKTRQGAKSALEALGYSSTINAMISNLALSLTDCYWIKPRYSDLRWEDVNLFENDFTDSFGEYTFTQNSGDIRKETRFNCAATQGEVQKKWVIDRDGSRCLIKGNYGDSFQQSINEVFACDLMEQAGFHNYTEYKLTPIALTDDRVGIGCVSKNFCSTTVECISAWEMLQTVKTKRNESLFYPFRQVCNTVGISDEVFSSFLDVEIMIDFLMSNTDRHMNNISLLRNPDTLEFIGFAPVYDSGNSMFFRESLGDLRKPMGTIKTHSFVEKEKDLLKYVSNRNAINLDKIKPNFDIYYQYNEERHSRIPLLKERFEKKMDILRQFQKGKDVWKDRHKGCDMSR